MRFNFLLAVVPILLTGCDGNLSTWFSQYWPSVNPEQQYTMTVDGYLDPSLADQIDLQFHVTYRSTNPSCRKYASLLEGASFDRQITLDYPVRSVGDFQLQLPLDYYLPGACEWSFSSVDYEVLYVNTKKIFASVKIAYYEKNVRATQEAYSTFICKDKYNLASCEISGYSFFNRDKSIGLGNYKFKFIMKVQDNVNHP